VDRRAPVGSKIAFRDMKREPDKQRHDIESAPKPKLISAGSVNRVLLVGGKNLTIFQSIGLMFIGVCVAGGIGGMIFVAEFGFDSGSGDHSYAFYLLFFACAMIIWELVMIVNGVRGVVRRTRRAR
jgi:hypothetical protein